MITTIITWSVIGLVALIALVSTFFTVDQQTAAVVERFGKFVSVRRPGLNLKIPFIDSVVGRPNLQVRELDVDVETKTKDNVFVNLKVSVQYQVIESKVWDAFYKLFDPQSQITSYVFDIVRAEVPKLSLDDVFEKKDDIASAVKAELNDVMDDFGYDIIKSLVTDIDPNKEVKSSMNRINAAEREKVAAQFEADAERIKIVEVAKAEAQSKKLQGEGIANQRRAIAKGLEDSVETLKNAGINPQEASALIVVTQHYDTLDSVGENSNSNLILLPNSPSGATDTMTSMIAALQANQTASKK